MLALLIAAEWAASVATYGYIVPNDTDYAQPTVTADRGSLHFEGRYNYEDRRTGSAWIGWKLAAGETVSFELTPIVGAVFGNTTGFAPGYKLAVAWWKLQLYSEAEYVISDEPFFYVWSELTISPWEFLRTGLVMQRTRAYQTERDVQRGLLAGVTWERVDFTTYVFNFDTKAAVVLAAAVRF